MEDHFINNTNLIKCRICRNDLTDKPWTSQWEAGNHYKINTCNQCGKKNWVTVKFSGSGDDNWQPGLGEELE